jgi:phage baseplate assembly protein W
MPAISFKDVGVTGFKQQDVLNRNKTIIPIGIKTPVEPDPSENGIFLMNTDIKAQVADNLRNLILTNWGERLGNYFLGANLRPLLVDFSSKDDFDQDAMVRINTAISRWMPFVTPVAFESVVDNVNNVYTGIVKLTLIYSVTSLGINNAKLEVTLFVI